MEAKMLNDTLTLTIDLLNNGTTSTEENLVFERVGNKSTYHRTGHSVTMRKMINFYRSLPKRVGSFLGVAKTSVKFTEDITVAASDGSNVVAPIILEVNFSFPVGTTIAQTVAMRQRALALLDDSITMDKLNLGLHV